MSFSAAASGQFDTPPHIALDPTVHIVVELKWHQCFLGRIDGCRVWGVLTVSGGLFSSNLSTVKRKIFISYHHGGDQPYYDAFSKAFHNNYEVITDNSLDREVKSNDVDYVMRRIRENYITGSSCTIVLVGQETHKRKYADWEIKATLDKQHGLIGVWLPTAPVSADNKITVPGRLHDNIQSGYAVWCSWADLTASALACQRYIEAANGRDKRLIQNSRDRMTRNG